MINPKDLDHLLKTDSCGGPCVRCSLYSVSMPKRCEISFRLSKPMEDKLFPTVRDVVVEIIIEIGREDMLVGVLL